MAISLLMLASLASAPITCAPPDGAQALVSRSSLRWLLLGEAGHGTNEMPSTLADLVCAVGPKRRQITVGIEVKVINQPWLNTFMRSNGGPAARTALLSAPMWDPEWADGKSSQAMLALLEWLRVQHRHGKVRRVIAFDPDSARSGADREQQMAQRLQATAPSGNGLFIVLTGSFHARKRLTDVRTATYPPMAMLMPRSQTISIRIQGFGGKNWSCTRQGCGEQDAGQTGGTDRQLSMRPTPDGSYDGEFELGLPVTPSPPVKTIKPQSGAL